MIYQCILTQNDCYKAGKHIVPKGIMVHSTGANNPWIKRYVQPVPADARITSILGHNMYNNHWNRSGVKKCVHAFIGKDANGIVSTCQTLPWDMRGWHAGGNANNTHIGFEICEDDLTDKGYFFTVFDEATDLCANLCQMFNLDPLSDGVIICHSEGYKRGIASGHADVMHWFPKFGLTMDDFRQEVRNKIDMDNDIKEEEETVKRYNTMDEIKTGANWAYDAIKHFCDIGLIVGGGKGKDAAGYPTDMDFSVDMLRMFSVMYMLHK